VRAPLKAPAPRVLLSYAETSLNFTPGTKYEYSNSDNIIAALTLGFTQFLAASENGTRLAVVSVNAQITPALHPERFADLLQVYSLAVSAALASGA
jgi:hypothetical protein